LAREFMRTDWDIKAMQRLIMNSMTYRMSSRPNTVALEKDPANFQLWRFPMRRLSAEELRDSIIQLSGLLNPAVGGPSFFPVLDEAVLATSSTKAGKWGNSPEEERNRRSLYITIKRSLKPPELVDFDFGDTDAPCAMRFVTTVPTQALGMLNGRFYNEQATAFAERVEAEAPGGGSEAFVRRALELALTREITPEDIANGMNVIERLQKEHGLDDRIARERFCLVVINLNEFLYLD